jgi:hypothetical protein
MRRQKFEQKVKELLEKYGHFVVDTGFLTIYANGYKIENEAPYELLYLFWDGNEIAKISLFDVDKVGIRVGKNE